MTSNSSDDSSFIEQQQPAVVSLSYNDLVAFSSSDPLSTNESSSSALLLRQSLIQKVGQAFGKDGLGILFITNVPDLSQQRQQLLPLAKAIPTLPNLDSVVHAESLYSTGWSHGKELGDLSKGSYYANPLVEDILEALVERDAPKAQYYQDMAQRHPECYAPNIWPTTSLPQLQTAFLQLGQTIQTTGILLAAICDAYCLQIANVKLNLQETLQRSLNVKGRLLHYFASEPSPTAAAATTIAKDQHYSNEQEKEDANSDVMWCNWHNDHGSLTGLVPAMFFDKDGQEIKCPDPKAGLYIQTRLGEIVRVGMPSSPNVLAFQIGETAQIQSGGVLQATPHAVKPTRQHGVSRESFAVFMEPEFDDMLDIPTGFTLADVQDSSRPLPSTVAPLKQRFRPGQTFGDFHTSTVTAFTPL